MPDQPSSQNPQHYSRLGTFEGKWNACHQDCSQLGQKILLHPQPLLPGIGCIGCPASPSHSGPADVQGNSNSFRPAHGNHGLQAAASGTCNEFLMVKGLRTPEGSLQDADTLQLETVKPTFCNEDLSQLKRLAPVIGMAIYSQKLDRQIGLLARDEEGQSQQA